MPIRSRRLRLLFVVALIVVHCRGTRAEVVPESRLKAAILSKFPQFVEWPRAVVDGRQTLDVCVGSPDPFGADLESLLAGEAVNGHTLLLRHVNSAAEVGGCHVLFVPSRRGSAVDPLLAAATTLPILTVGDDPGFLQKGGIVALRVVNGRVRFEIDDATARRVGLKISSQLLRLAIAVRGGTA